MVGNRREELLSKAFPWVLGIVVFITSFLTPLQTPWEVASRNYSLFVAHKSTVVLLAMLSGATTVLVRRWIWPVCLVAALAWLAYSMWPAMVVASFYAALRWESRWRSVLYVTVALLLVVVSIAVGSTRAPIYGIRFATTMVPLIIMPYTAGLWVRTRRRLIDELRARNATLAAQARAEERTRIAREMHDVVAHRVAMIVLHAGALEVGARDEHTTQEAALIRSTGREALNELRHVLGVLREPGNMPAPQPLRASLDELVEQTRQAGVEVRLVVEGEPEGLPVTVERTVYRVVQEALTNVVKHAPGAKVEVLLRNGSGSLVVIVQNGPPAHLGRAQAAASGADQLALYVKRRYRGGEKLPSSGLGLIGLRERIDLLGGGFEAGPLPDGGFRVSARLPTDGNMLQLPGEDVRRAV